METNGCKHFPFRVDPFTEEGQTLLTEWPPMKVYVFTLKFIELLLVLLLHVSLEPDN